MNITGYSSNLYVWQERYKSEGLDHSLASILRDCAEAGLDAVETNTLPETVALVQSFGLRIAGTYVGLNLHEPYETLQVEEVVLPAAQRLSEVGGTDLIVNPNLKREDSGPVAKTVEELKLQGDSLSRIAKLVQPYGIKVAMHNHAAKQRLAEDDLLSVIEYADEQVGLCVDTGWAHTAGLNSLDWLRLYPSRIAAFHLRNQFGSVPTEDLLDGEIDMEVLVGLMKGISYNGWVGLELWQPKQTNPQRPMIEDVSRSLAYIKQLALG